MMNHETFTEIYRRYATLILKTVVAQTRDEETAKEICQQTFLSYYKNMDKVEPGMEKPWLLKTAKHLVIDYWRKGSTQNEILAENDSEELQAVNPHDMEKECVNKMFIYEILEDLERENKLWYEVIELLFVEQMDRDEAAKHLGISPAMLRARLYRAKQYLKRKYGREYEED